ncbi:hypothetical protein AB0C89_38030, partial [Streptomyces sp. NPDC048491]
RILAVAHQNQEKADHTIVVPKNEDELDPILMVIVTPQRWGRVPRTFLRCADDRALPTAVQDLMIAEADRAVPANPFTVRTLPGSHSPFAARPRELAAALLT